MRWLWVIGLVGCGRIAFDPITGDPGAGDGGHDDDGAIAGDTITGGADADLATSCSQPTASCAFNGPGTCSCWGSPIASAAVVTESGGQLRISPAANTIGASGSCQRDNVPLTPAGVFVEVTQLVSTAQGITSFIVEGAESFSIQVQGTTLAWSDGMAATVAYDAVTMRWWRIRPVAGGTAFERSPDGKTWTQFGAPGRVATSASYTVRIAGTTALGVGSPGSAIFESVNVCPP